VTDRIGRDRVTHSFAASAEPVARVAPGDRVVFETLDAAGGAMRTVEDALTLSLPRERANPATGPVFVDGAEPGDTLSVEILAIDVGTPALAFIRAGSGVIIDELSPPAARLPEVREGVVHFSDELQFAIKPMLGVVGVAPAEGEVLSFAPGSHGGNMDINAAAPGSIVYLPVCVPGALLAIGDVHARMGDGELTGGGLDISADVTVRVDLRRGLDWERPVIESPDGWWTCAHAPTIEEAVRQATSDMVALMSTALGISREEAFILVGAAGDARLGQAAALDVDVTAALAMPKEILGGLF
jgi:amidase